MSNLETTKDTKQSLESTQGLSENLAAQNSDLCVSCRMTIEDACARLGEKRWHINCLVCSSCKTDLSGVIPETSWSDIERRLICPNCTQKVPDARTGLEHTTRLKQYVFLLRVALARLLVMLRQGGTLPHTSGLRTSNRHDSRSN